jgi:hypothetical protein
LQPDRVTALLEGSDHVIHLHLKDRDWLINTGKLSQWRSLTEPYLQSQGVNRLEELILCGAAAHEAEILEQVNNDFQVGKVVSSFLPRAETRTVQFQVEPHDPTADASAGLVDILSPYQTGQSKIALGEPAIEGILVHLKQFRVLILPNVSEAGLAVLKCDHADVVYCGRLQGRHFPRNLILAKLSPSILVLNGTKTEVTANSPNNPLGPKCFYVKQDGAVTTSLLGDQLVIRGYRGSEFRLRSLSR